MQYLADTHCFLWYISGHTNLSSSARKLIDEKQNQIYVSIASLWQIAIKSALGKLTVIQSFEDLISDQLKRNDFTVLPISLDHLATLTTLPFHHRDPFDRLLIAQARTDDRPIITKDKIFNDYEVRVVW